MIESLLRSSGLDHGNPDTGLDADILAGILAASNDACWCMEFGTPVDLSAPTHEIIRQVFENDPFWRLANPAMSRLYLLEPTAEFVARPTSEIFPRNAQNERFVRQLIANGFEVDAAPALDRRYDGVEIYVENDVRAHIKDGHLLRMFGIVRDVGKHRRREALIQADLNEAIDILTALPQAVVALDAAGLIAAANPAAIRLLEVRAEDLLGRPASDIMASDAARTQLSLVLTEEVPSRIEDALFVWSLAPRAEGGVAAAISPRPAGGRP
jgi:PAS domain-containing protein